MKMYLITIIILLIAIIMLLVEPVALIWAVVLALGLSFISILIFMIMKSAEKPVFFIIFASILILISVISMFYIQNVINDLLNSMF